VCATVAFIRVINDALHMIYSFHDDEETEEVEEEVADDTSMTDDTLLDDPIDE
jgi:hypothetical protein